MAEKHKEQASYSPMDRNCDSFEPYFGVSSYPGYYGVHCHDFFEFYIFFQGAPYFCMDDNMFPLESCTLVILPPFHLHGLVTNQESSHYERAWLYVTPAMMQSVSMGLFDFSEFFTECVRKGKAYFRISPETAEQCRDLIKKLKENINPGSAYEKWRNNLYVSEFLSKIRDLAAAAEPTEKPIVLNQSIQNVIDFVNAHYTESISIPELTKKFGISASYMSKEFSAYTGRSIYDYVLFRRIMLAKQMIVDGIPFTEVAFECGFNDYSGFLRAFTKLTSRTPSAYKKYMKSITEKK